MNYTTTIEYESKVFPEVTYVLNKMSEARRAQLRLLIAGPTAKVRNLIRELQRLEDRYPADENNPRDEEINRQMFDMTDQMEQISADEIDPKWLLWGLKSIAGLEIDGQPATPKSLLEDGPPMLFAEIVAKIKQVAQLNGAEEKNSGSPTTSGELTGGETTNSSAVSASSSDSTPQETAQSTSPSE